MAEAKPFHRYALMRLCLLLLVCLSVHAKCTRELSMIERNVERDTRWVDAIFAEADCRIKRLPNPERIIDRMWAIRTGQVDVLSAITPLPERNKFGYFSEPYDREKIVLLAHQQFAQRVQLHSLRDVVALGITVIGPQSGYYGPEWDQVRDALRAKDHLVTYPNWRHGASVLLRNPSFVMLMPEDSAQDVIRRTALELRQLPLVIYQSDVVLMFSRETVDVADIAAINAAIVRLKARPFSP